MSDVWTTLRDGTLSAGAAVWDMANVETLRLAITGLSGAGKTVLLVSVISNLLASQGSRSDAARYSSLRRGSGWSSWYVPGRMVLSLNKGWLTNVHS
jgi:GTPase SAR1 family protein